MFSDEMDLLIMATENGDIYLWEFDDSISGPVPEDNSEVDENQQIMEKYEILLSQGSPIESQPTQKNTKILNKHLAGFTCKKVLAGHFKAVTALAIVGKESGFSTVYL